MFVSKWTRKMLSVPMALVMLAVMLAGGVGTAFADTPGGSVTLAGGSLSESVSAITINGGSNVTLNGLDQNITVAMPIVVTDPTGSGAGWNVTIKADAFSDGGGTPVYLHNAPKVSAVSFTDYTGSTDTDPTNTVSYTGGLAIPTGSTPAPLFNAALNTGLGKFTLTPTMTLKVQGNDAPGTYTSTFTLAINSGP